MTTPVASLALPELTHERVEFVTGPRSGLPIGIALHSTALGPGLGGCRLWHYGHWAEALGDVMRLSAAMTLKNSLAGLDYGGGKAVIALGEGDAADADRRRDALLDLGDLVETFDGTYITTEDVGATEHDMVVVRERTRHVVGLPATLGGAGEPAEGTALGVHASLEVVLERLWDSPAVAGRSFVISGLGQVGSRLARLPVRAVVGPANNPLAEREGATLLEERGILYAPDFLVNAGGVIHLALIAEGATSAALDARLHAIGDTLARVLDAAESEGITPLAAAEAIAFDRVSAASR